MKPSPLIQPRWALAALSCAIASACATPVPGSEGAASRAPDVVFVPTPHSVVARMLEVAKVAPGDTLYDLGSGDGRIVIAAARRFGARGIGIDIDPALIRSSRANADTARVADLVEFREADLFTTDLRSASVVTLYLLPELNLRLRPKLFTELRPGSRVVSHSFDMGDWKADSTLIVDGRLVFYWLMPADMEGTWTIAAGDRSYAVGISQEFQRITGATVREPANATIRDVTVSGDSVRFIVDAGGSSLQFAGSAHGDSMSGTFTAAGTAGGEWRASRAR